MGTTTRVVLAALATTFTLAGCAGDLTTPQRAPSQRAAMVDCGGPGEPMIDLNCGDPGDGGGIGDPSPPPPPPAPYDPPPSPVSGVDVPIDYYGISNPLPSSHCLQNTVLYLATGNDVQQGTPLYPAGIVVKNTKAKFYFFNEAGQLVKIHLTQPARDNCVIHQEPEAMSTWDMPPGYYYVYANWWTLAYPYGNGGITGWPIEHGTTFITALRIR